MFVTKEDTPVDPANVRSAVLRVLKAAKLPLHFTPHCLRHLCVDSVGGGCQSCLRARTARPRDDRIDREHVRPMVEKKAPGALDQLDRALHVERGSKVVAEGAVAGGSVGTPTAGLPCIQAFAMEPAIRIERTTCGLRM